MAKRVEVVITDKKKINHDCYIYSFEYVNEKIAFTIGTYFRIIKVLPTHDHPEGEELAKKYTPINPCAQIDKIDFLVKIYRPNVHPDFPHGGKFTPWLESQGVGDKLIIEGPYGRFGYKTGGSVTIDEESYQPKRLFYMAGGSGITPVFQTIMEIAAMKDENIEIILLFANKNEEDIVLRKELQSMGHRIKIHYILDKAPNEDWKHYKGYVTHEILKQICPLDDPSTIYIHCGPFPMNKLIRQIFSEHYPKSVLFKF